MKVLLLLLLSFSAACETVGVVGTGYVGLVLTSMLAKWGYEVVCIDIDEVKIGDLNRSILPIFEPGLKELLFKKKDRITFSTNFDLLNCAPIVFICVPTPPDATGNCNCAAIYLVLDRMEKWEMRERTICIKSTVSPGTIQKIESYLGPDSKSAIVYNPEFMREGSALSDIENMNPIVIGSRNEKGKEPIGALYAPLLRSNNALEMIQTSPETAELIKYSWNGFSAIRISYVNELSRLCSTYRADLNTLLRAISWSERMVPTAKLAPGIGIGGSCLPKDTLAMSRIFESIGIENSLIHQAIRSNRAHTEALIHQCLSYIGKKPQRIAVLGTAFKANTDDMRNAPSVPLIQALINAGHTIQAYDPHAMKATAKLFPQVAFYDDPYRSLENVECAIILTESSEFQNLDLDRARLSVSKQRIIDYKNVIDPAAAKKSGFEIVNLGRSE